MGERLDTVVKLVVAENLYVISEIVHHLSLSLAFVDGEIECALNHVSAVDEQHVGLLGSHAVNKDFSAQYSAEVIVVGVKLAVGVIGVKYHEVVGRRQ